MQRSSLLAIAALAVACTPAFDRPRPGGRDVAAERARADQRVDATGDQRLCPPRPHATVVFGPGGECRYLCEAGYYDCDGSGCSATAPCTPELIDGAAECAKGLALDATHVYWFSGDAIWRAAKASPGVKEKVADAEQGVETVAARDGDPHVYWIVARDTGGVYRAPKTGGVKEKLQGVKQPRALALDGENYYWVYLEGSAQTIAREAKGIKGVVKMATGLTLVWALAVDTSHLYLTSGAQGDGWPSAVEREDKKAVSPALEVVAGKVAPLDLAVSSSFVFWLGQSSIQRAAKTPGPATTIITGLALPGRMALDDLHVYWTTPAKGELSKIARTEVNRSADAAIPVAAKDGNERPWALAVDDQHLYWTTVPGAADHKDPGGCQGAQGKLRRVRK